MEKAFTEIGPAGKGAFFFSGENGRIAEMDVSVSGNLLTVFHTEVKPVAEGRGLAKELLNTMVTYAREHGLRVNPLCPFVSVQFRRHPDEYADLWQEKK